MIGAILTAVGAVLSLIPETSLTSEPSEGWCLRCYCSVNKHVVITLENATKFCDSECINLNLITVIHMPGYRHTLDKPEVKEFLKFKEDPGLSATFNYCVLDWSKKATVIEATPFLDYPLVVANMYEVCKQVTKLFLILFEKCLNRHKLYIVGFSMGGQLAGVVGTNLTQKGLSFARLYAVDPAAPGFDVLPHVTKDSALLVFAFHFTKLFGEIKNIGKCDFYFNYCCFNQPGCNNEMESHMRAPPVFMESTTNPEGLQAVSVLVGKDFCANKIPSDNPIIAGFWVLETCSGSYYLSTAAQPPYGLGAAGTQPASCS